jgi:hypothetical protein
MWILSETQCALSQYMGYASHTMDSVSGVGVLDKAFLVMNALVTRPLSLNETVEMMPVCIALVQHLLV